MKAKVKNLQTITRALEKYENDIEEGVKDAIQKSTYDIEFDATNMKKSASIIISKDFSNSGLTGMVTATHAFDNKLAAYINFGTGIFAAEYLAGKPKRVVELARQYFVNGKGRLKSNPYLTQPYLQRRQEFLNNVRKLVKQRTKS